MRPTLRVAALILCVFFRLLPAAAAVQCSAVAQNAVQNFVAKGTGWMCCSSDVVDCVPLQSDAVCDSDHGAYAQCVNLGGVKACGMTEYAGITDGAPCGVYGGAQSQSKFSGFEGNSSSSLPQQAVANAVLSSDNWPTLGFENYLSLCCGQSGCLTVNVTSINDNECASGESILKCAGDGTHGICSIWSGDKDSGQFFLVNTDAPDVAPSSASSSPPKTKTAFTSPGGENTTSSTSTASSTSSTGTSTPGGTSPAQDAPNGPSAPGGSSTPSTASTAGATAPPAPVAAAAAAIPTWAIALIAGLSGLLVLCALTFLWSRGCCGLRRNRPAIDPFMGVASTPALPTVSVAPKLVIVRQPPDPAPPQYTPADPLNRNSPSSPVDPVDRKRKSRLRSALYPLD